MTTSKAPIVDDSGEVRELTGPDFKRARKASDAFPGTLQAKLGMLRSKPRAADEVPLARGSKILLEKSDLVERPFSRFADLAKQRYSNEGKLAADELVLHVETGGPRLPSYLKRSVLKANINVGLQKVVYDQLVFCAFEKYHKHYSPEDEVVLQLFNVDDASDKPSHSELERLGKSRLAELVQVQSEMLENFKILLTAVSPVPPVIEGVEPSAVRYEVDRAGFAKRLRQLAEAVEMSDPRSRSRA